MSYTVLGKRFACGAWFLLSEHTQRKNVLFTLQMETGQATTLRKHHYEKGPDWVGSGFNFPACMNSCHVNEDKPDWCGSNLRGLA